jgi:hypothetical protein
MKVKMIRIAVIFLSSSFLFAAAGKAAEKFVLYKNNYFSANIPNWPVTVTDNKNLKVYGISVNNPKSSEKKPASIYVSYFTKGNKDYPSIDAYVKGVTYDPFNLVGVDSTKTSTLKTCYRKRCRATVFETTDITYFPPRSPDAEKIDIKEKYVLFPDSKNKGFYVVRLYSGKFNYPKNLKRLDRVLNNFRRFE